jgi:hypothetical protein
MSVVVISPCIVLNKAATKVVHFRKSKYSELVALTNQLKRVERDQ